MNHRRFPQIGWLSIGLAMLALAIVGGLPEPGLAQRQPSPTAEAIAPEYDGEFFTDLSRKVRGPSKAQISKRLRIAAESSRIHPMLAVVNRMSEYPGLPQEIQAFAAKLATDWKIGDQQTKHGLLVLFALEDRKFSVVKTKDLSQSVPDAIKRSLQGRVTDLLKAGEVDRAMLLAADSLADNLPAAAKSQAGGTPGAVAPGTGGPGKTVTRTVHERRYAQPSHMQPYGASRHVNHSSGGFAWIGLIIGAIILFVIVMSIVGVIASVAHGFGPGMGGGGYSGGWGGGGWGGGGGFLPGMLTGGLMGWMFSGGHGWGGGWGGGWGSGGWNQQNGMGNFTDTTTTETWSQGGGSGFGGFGGGDGGGGGFDSFGGGNFDGGGSSGEW